MAQKPKINEIMVGAAFLALWVRKELKEKWYVLLAIRQREVKKEAGEYVFPGFSGSVCPYYPIIS
jgi:hypothetical protein